MTHHTVISLQERFQGCLLGLAVGDAVGTTVEFAARGSFPLVTDMIGGGPFRLKAGQWTDDTSMALCLATSLITVGDFDPVDQMNRYCDWYETGYLSSTGQCFDIGNTVRQALHQYRSSGIAFSGSTHPQSAGNGCLMRLAPIPMFYFPDRQQVRHFSVQSSRTTHGATECLDASWLFGDMLCQVLAGASKTELLFSYAADHDCQQLAPSIQAIAQGNYRDKTIAQIRGSGYVVASLEAALWCFWHTENYEQAVLAATNLGDDADTTAAICGSLAGAYYGVRNIPESWRNKLAMVEQITTLADQLHQVATTR